VTVESNGSGLTVTDVDAVATHVAAPVTSVAVTVYVVVADGLTTILAVVAPVDHR
jgi:hypothetical protein